MLRYSPFLPEVLEEILARCPDYGLDEARLVRRRADQIQGLVSLPIGLAPGRKRARVG